MANLLFLGLAVLVGIVYADLLPTTVTEWFWQSCKHVLSADCRSVLTEARGQRS
jgi:hypothetical protein